VKRALEIEGGPIVFSDAADAPTAGAPGDSPVILKELLGKEIKGKAMLPIVDPEAVKNAIKAGVGEGITLEVGGKFDTINFQPIRVTGKVRTITDGRFVIRDKVGKDSKVNMKRTIVLEVDDVYIVLSEAKGPSHVPSFYRSVGLDPKEAKIVVAKSPYLFREAYEPIAKEIILVDAPGMCSSDLQSLAELYKTPPRPLFPLDEGVTFQI
jgi:microcystin degradation protein MlrC